MHDAALRRAAPLLLALAALSFACSRDLDLPDASPPRIDAVAVVGLEPQGVVSSLSVLGGELVAIRGGGFPTDVAEVEVRIGSEDAEVLETRFDRIVARMPALGTWGRVDLSVRTAVGFRSLAGAFRYDGPGQPSGFASSDLDTSVDLGFVTPVGPPGPWGFSDLAIATGASDSALLVVPAVGMAVAAIPLGVVPTSAAGWIENATTDPQLRVLAVSRGGAADPLAASLAMVPLTGSSIAQRATLTRLSWSLGNPSPCAVPLVTFAVSGRPVASWAEGPAADQHRLATVDLQKAIDEATLASIDPAGVHTLLGPIAGWGAWGASSVIFAAASELWAYDTATPRVQPRVLRIPGGVGPAVSSLLTPGVNPDEVKACGPSVQRIYSVATASAGTTDALAVSYRAGNVDRVALVDLGPGPGAGTVRSGIAGTARASLALAPDPEYATTPGWQVLGTGATTSETNLVKYLPLEGAPLCGDLVPRASHRLTDAPAYVGLGGLATVVNGTAVLAITGDGELVTVYPSSLTSTGPIVRFASYGGVSVQQATIGDTAVPVAIAEHAATDTAVSDVDTGSAVLAVSLTGDRGSVALGGSGYGRGAVWLEAPGGGALAYTGDLRAAGTDGFKRGGAAAVTPLTAGRCEGETIRIGAARPVNAGPDLVAQGPARAGAFGPDGVGRFGPTVPPIYTVKDQSLHVYLPDPAKLACLAGDGGEADWDPAGACTPDRTLEIGFRPLDVTLSAGDRAAAFRYIGPCAPADPTRICLPGDDVCQRAECPPASELVIAWPDAEAVTTAPVPLPASPASVAADRGGGFLVTMRCEAAPSGRSGECFLADALCDEYGTVPDEENGALVLVSEDGLSTRCLAVQAALAGPVAVTPNGAEAWVSGATAAGQFLVRLGLARRTSDGAIDAARAATLVSSEAIYAAPRGTTAPPGGVAFTPDGTTAVVAVPGQYRVLLRE